MAELGHLQRIHGAGAVSGPRPIATDRRVAIRAAVRSNGPQPAITLPSEMSEISLICNRELSGRDIMNRRTTLAWTTTALLGLTVATALPQIVFAQSNMVGTWKLNLAKSTYSPGAPPPRSITLHIQAEEQGFRVTLEGIDAQGNPTGTNFGFFTTDGKFYSMAGVPRYDAFAFKRVDDSTWEITRTKGGKVVQFETGVTSADGKTQTYTSTSFNEDGRQSNNVIVFDKQ
jgi:hypothetical protein